MTTVGGANVDYTTAVCPAPLSLVPPRLSLATQRHTVYIITPSMRVRSNKFLYNGVIWPHEEDEKRKFREKLLAYD